MIYYKLKYHVLPSFLSSKPTEVLLLLQGVHLTGKIGPIASVVLLSAWPENSSGTTVEPHVEFFVV